MNRSIALIGGAGVGAGLMYLLDPDRGRRRRALIEDQFVRSTHAAGDAAEALANDARNRGQGVLAWVRSWFGTEREELTDDVLVERVRARLGLLSRHPRAIEVQAQDGRITVSGPILQDEVEHLLRALARVPGVRQVIDRLQVHAEAGDIPELQGGPREWKPGPTFELLQRNWAPTARALTGVTGAGLALYGIRSGGPVGTALTVTGAGLFATGITNRDLWGLAGDAQRAARRAFEGRRNSGTRVQDIMTPNVETVRPDATLEDAAEIMKRLNVGAVPVCDGDRIVGMLTDRDIVTRIVAEKREPKAAKVRDAMTPDVAYCYAEEDVASAARLMEEKQIRRLLVMDRGKQLVGIVSLGDLAVDTRNQRMSGRVLESISEPAKS